MRKNHSKKIHLHRTNTNKMIVTNSNNGWVEETRTYRTMFCWHVHVNTIKWTSGLLDLKQGEKKNLPLWFVQQTEFDWFKMSFSLDHITSASIYADKKKCFFFVVRIFCSFYVDRLVVHWLLQPVIVWSGLCVCGVLVLSIMHRFLIWIYSQRLRSYVENWMSLRLNTHLHACASWKCFYSVWFFGHIDKSYNFHFLHKLQFMFVHSSSSSAYSSSASLNFFLSFSGEESVLFDYIT